MKPFLKETIDRELGQYHGNPKKNPYLHSTEQGYAVYQDMLQFP